MTEIKLYKTPWKAVKIFALTIPFVAIGIWMITENESTSTVRFMGWFGIIFFGLGLPVGFFHLFDRRPQIIINENGIWDRTTNQDEIKWEQIKGAYPIDIYGQKFISLVVDESFVFKKKQYKWATKLSEAVGAQKLNLHLGQIKTDEKQFANFITKMSKAKPEERSTIIKSYFA